MENYIVINGKKAELTKAQLKQLGIKVENENPFERIDGKVYYVIAGDGSIPSFEEDGGNLDEKFYELGNYCRDETLMRQRALHEILNRILWRFACENGELENEWRGYENRHYCIYFDVITKTFGVQDFETTIMLNNPYFPSKEIAQLAINTIVLPFVKDHPDFIW